MARLIKVSLFVLIAAFMLATQTEAGYIDPNTGGMLFQMLAATFTLLSGFILVFAGRIKMFFLTMRRRFLDRKQKTQ